MQSVPRTSPPTLAWLAAALLTLIPGLVSAEPQRRTVVAGTYKADGFHRFLLGSDYRDTWATPVSVEVLDLAKEAGGLTPVRPRRRAADEGPRPQGRGRPQLHLPRAREGRVAPARRHRPGAEGLGHREDRSTTRWPRSTRRASSIARGILDAVGRPVPGLAARGPARRPGARQVPEGLRGRHRRLRGVPAAGQGNGPRLPGRHRDHRPHGALQAAGGGRGRRGGHRRRCCRRGSWTSSWATGTGTASSGAGRRLPGSPLWMPIPEDRDQAFSRYEGVRARHGARDATRASRTSRPKYPNIGGLTFNGSEQDRRLLVGFSREDFVRDGEGPAGPAHRRGDREGGPADAARVVRASTARGSSRPSRPAATPWPTSRRSTTATWRAASTST